MAASFDFLSSSASAPTPSCASRQAPSLEIALIFVAESIGWPVSWGLLKGPGTGTTGTGWYYCQSAFDAPTAQAAEAAPAADASDPANGGCGGAFPWSALAPGLAIAGEYTDNFAGYHQISTAFWQQGEGADASWHWLYAVDAEAGWMVAQNDGDNPFSPGLFSRFDWTVGEDGTLYFCQSAFDADSAEAAAAAPAPDASNPAEGGCGGMFPWSALSPR